MSNMIGQPADPLHIEKMLKAAFHNSLPAGVHGTVKDVQIMPDGSVNVKTEVNAPAPLKSFDFMEFSVDGTPRKFSMKNYLYNSEGLNEETNNETVEYTLTAKLDY